MLDRLEDALPILVLVVLGNNLGRGELGDQAFGECALLVTDLRISAPVDLGCVVYLVSEVKPLEEEAALVPADRDRCRLAAPGECADGDPVRLPKRLGEHPIAPLAVLAGAEVVRVLEVHGVDRPLRDERVNDERRGGRLFEGLQLFWLEAHVLVLSGLVPFDRLFARDEVPALNCDAHRAPLRRRHYPSSLPRILVTKPPGASEATSPFTRSRISATFPVFSAAFIVLKYAVQTSAPVIS